MACQPEVPCVTEGAKKDDHGLCECPDGTKAELIANGTKSRCMSTGPGIDVDGSSPDGELIEEEGRDGGPARDGRVEVARPDGAGPCGPLVCPREQVANEVSCTCSGPDGSAPPGQPVAPSCVPSSEVCNRQDDDCDGVIDDGVTNACGGCGEIEAARAKGTPCSNGGKGGCALPGTYECLGDTTVCNAPDPTPSDELCDGKDNDCDGETDEGLRNSCDGCQVLANEKGAPCGAGTGECAAPGTYVCATTEATTCNAVARAATAEICDSKDNDCDGVVDEGLGKGDACTLGVGECMVTGVRACTPSGTVACNATVKLERPEVCDSKDNDCDGAVDEDDVCKPASVCGDGKVTEGEACDIKLTNDWHCTADCSAVRASATGYLACDPASPKCGFGEGCVGVLGGTPQCYPYKTKAGVGSCTEIVKAPFAIANGSSTYEMCVLGCGNTGTPCPNHLTCSLLANGNGTCILQ
jgi:hypothetical protein